MSECPEGTYFDAATHECRLCNSNKCRACIRDANTCVRCEAPLALDVAGFTCKPCCSRSLHGKVKEPPSCCVCGTAPYSGFCDAGQATRNSSSLVFRMFERVKSSSKMNSTFFVIAVVTATGLSLLAIVSIGKTCKKHKEFVQVEYVPLKSEST